MIEERYISNYLEEAVIMELRSCFGWFVGGLRETMKKSQSVYSVT